MRSFLRYAILLLLGARGTGAITGDFVLAAARAGLRSPANWFVPAAAGLLLAIGVVFLRVDGTASGKVEGGQMMLARVVPFELGVLVAAVLSGYVQGLRWRRASDLIEELAISPARPQQVALMMIAGSAAPWIVVFVVLALLEWGTLGVLYLFTDVGQNPWQGGNVPTAPGTLPKHSHFPALIALGIHFYSLLAMAALHLTTVIAILCMNLHNGLPRHGAVSKAIEALLVGGLTAVGLLTIGVGALAFTALCGAFIQAVFFQGRAISAITDQTLWAAAAAPSLLLLAGIKLYFARQYASRFERLWLMFQWWGSAESEQPPFYPGPFSQGAELWATFYRMREEEELNDANPTASKRTSAKQRYQRLLAALGTRAPAPPIDRDTGAA